MTEQQLTVLAQLATALDAASNCRLFSTLEDTDYIDWQSVHQFIDAVHRDANNLVSAVQPTMER